MSPAGGRAGGLPGKSWAKKVTRQLPEKHPDMQPLVAPFYECHEVFSDPDLGREAADLAMQTMRSARKTAITLEFNTRSSRANANPVEGSSSGLLGDGSF